MLSKEEIEKAKEDFNFFNEGDYITKEMFNSKEKIFEYIKKIEADNYEQNNIINDYIDERRELIEKLEERIKSVEQCYDELLTDVGGVKIINVTGLSRKEKEEVINKRNCLLVQKHCYQEILEIVKGEKEVRKCK